MRLFVASFLRPSNQESYRRLIDGLAARQPGVIRAVPDGTVHLTYAFIPQADESRLHVLLAAIGEVSAGHRPLEIGLGPPRVLSGGSAPRLICADLTAGAESIRRLTDDLAAALARALPEADVRPSRTPHLTLARFRRQATRAESRHMTRLLAGPTARFEGRDRVERIALVASMLTASGPLYEIQGARRLGD